jgi:hypothetical protein
MDSNPVTVSSLTYSVPAARVRWGGVVGVGCDLELELTPGPGPGAYAVAVDSPAGAAVGTVRLDVAGLLARRRELAASVLASAVTARAGLSGPGGH